MEVKKIWKVSAKMTRDFRDEMLTRGIHADPPATLLNTITGYNFFYETEESYGDITEDTAMNIARANNLSVMDYVVTYYVMAPYEPMTETEFLRRREEFMKENRKCIGIVFNCKDSDDFSRKWFGK